MAKKSFEQALQQLEQIVRELESGDLPLEAALRKFEEGIELSKFCSQKLEETERRITVLLQNEAGESVEKPLSPEPGAPRAGDDEIPF
ncbi:MAG: exodeoxyribonuclease VII small subunit [Desulfobacterales bacterium]